VTSRATDAVLDARKVSLTVVALLGGVRIIVPPGVEVDVDGFTLLGGRQVEVDQSPPGRGATHGVGRRELRRQRRQLR